MKKTRLLIASAVVIANMLWMSGCTQPDPPTIPFFLALQRGDLNQIERHIHYGVDIDGKDANGRSPLHLAAQAGNWVVTEILLKNGANIEATDRDGHTPLAVALLAGRTQIAGALIKFGATFDADALLHEVTLAGVSDRDVTDFLLKNGANLNHIAADGKTPLILAIERDDRLMAKLLISRGANVNLADASGRLPLTVANAVGNQAIIRLLRQYGAMEDATP